MPAYPITLPKPLVNSYALAPVDQTIRTDMEVGAGRVRRRTFARNDSIEISFVFTSAQFAAFRTWFEDGVSGIAGGSSWFDIPLDVGHGSVTSEEARFDGPWKASRDGRLWKVTAKLEVR